MATSRNAEEPERVVQVVLRVSLEASSATSGTPHQPVPQTPFDVAPDEVVCLHDWPLVEVAAPTAQQRLMTATVFLGLSEYHCGVVRS